MNLFKHRSDVNCRSTDNPGGPRIRLSTGRGEVRRPRLTGFAGAVLAMVLAMPPMSAVASVEIRQGDQGREIYYSGFDESNDLSISRDDRFFYFREGTLENPGVVIGTDEDEDRCTRPTMANNFAQCPAGGVVRVLVELRIGNDRLRGPSQPPPPGESVPLRAEGGLGDDILASGADNDELQGQEGNDHLLGGDGNDTLDFPFPDFPFSGGTLDPSRGRDDLNGGPGDDKLNGGPAGQPLEADVLNGGEGTDTADFSKRTELLTLELDGDADDGQLGEGDNVQPDVECLWGGSNDDILIGSSAANCLDGRGGADIIEARGGDDKLLGGLNDPSGDSLSGEGGNDTMLGGSGDDSLVGGEGGDDGSGEGGSDRVEGDAGNDLLAGGAGVDRVDGGGGDDLLNGGGQGLRGGEASDELLGRNGDDRLFGGQGNDLLDGGLGADLISGESDRDTVTYEDRTNRVFVTLDGEANDGEADEHDNVLRDVEVVLGAPWGDDLSGDVDDDTIAGESGQDLIGGKLGEDLLLGGDAADVVMARDGDPDDVVCGADGDLAIADDQDNVTECPTVDRPGARRPMVGRLALVRPKGKFQLRLPQGPRFFGLKQKELTIPIGSTVDPKADVVRLVTARNRTGGRQVASVSAGRFTVRQRGRRRPVTELRLAGRLPDCRGSSPRGGRAKRAARASARTLRVDVGGPVSAARVSKRAGVSGRPRGPRQRGRFWVLGRNSVGASHGTEWVTKDRCDGTLTRVISGTVHVRDFGKRETIKVHAGESHLAAAP